MKRDFDNLLRWFTENNGTHKIDILEENNECKSFFKEDIDESKLVLACPLNLMITLEDLKNYLDDNLINSLNKSVQLGLLLYFYDKTNNNKFKNYLNSLPSNLSHLPFLWNKKELILIKNSSFYEDFISHKIEFDESYKKLKENNIIDCDIEKFYFYICLVVSRNFSFYYNQNKKYSLVPIADLIDHSNEPNCTWIYNNLYDRFEIRTLKNCKKGEEILISYGNNKEDKSFLLFYGFNPQVNDRLFLNSEKKYLDEIEKNNEKIKKLVSNKLSRFPTTLEEDKELLKKSKNLNEKNAYLILIYEKEKLIKYLNE